LRDILGAVRRRTAHGARTRRVPSVFLFDRVSTAIRRPSIERVAASNLRRFIAGNREQLCGDDCAALYAWSIKSPADFWAAVWRFCEIRAAAPYDPCRAPRVSIRSRRSRQREALAASGIPERECELALERPLPTGV
jgi:hypothetical protein